MPFIILILAVIAAIVAGLFWGWSGITTVILIYMGGWALVMMEGHNPFND